MNKTLDCENCKEKGKCPIEETLKRIGFIDRDELTKIYVVLDNKTQKIRYIFDSEDRALRYLAITVDTIMETHYLNDKF
jgi:hypothetical protein